MKWVTARDISHTPLTMARKVRRGFSRIGLVLAVLTMCAGTVLAAALATEAADGAVKKHVAMTCLKTSWAQGKAYARQYSQETVDAEASGCPYAYTTWSDLLIFEPAKKPSWTGTLILSLLQGLAMTIFATALAFAGPWTIGWILSGFLGE